jgi:DNA repair exonuclease SbcCD nuclease subunit
MWLLGHVHAPRLVAHDGRPAVLYPGSPQPMDPGETGARGAWVVELAAGAPVAPRLVPLASVRYESLDVDVGAAADVDAARDLTIARVREAAAAMAAGAHRLRHLSLRLRLVGRTPLHRRLEREGRALAADLELPVDGVVVHVERVEVATRPARDLERLADGSDAASLLARLLRDLDAGAGVDAELLRAIELVPAALHAARPYRSLPWRDDELGPDALRDALAQQAGLLLDELLAQKEGAA